MHPLAMVTPFARDRNVAKEMRKRRPHTINDTIHARQPQPNHPALAVVSSANAMVRTLDA
eukprot:11169099-Lingulodinium_polyedra.AAC.1